MYHSYTSHSVPTDIMTDTLPRLEYTNSVQQRGVTPFGSRETTPASSLIHCGLHMLSYIIVLYQRTEGVPCRVLVAGGRFCHFHIHAADRTIPRLLGKYLLFTSEFHGVGCITSSRTFYPAWMSISLGHLLLLLLLLVSGLYISRHGQWG